MMLIRASVVSINENIVKLHIMSYGEQNNNNNKQSHLRTRCYMNTQDGEYDTYHDHKATLFIHAYRQKRAK